MAKKNEVSDELKKATLALENGEQLPSTVAYIRGETIWSYLGRLAQCNGFENTEDMIKLLCEKRKLNVSMAASIFKMVRFENGEYLREGSIFSVLKYFLRESDFTNLFHLYNGDINLSHVYAPWMNGTMPIKVCPECMKEDKETKVFHYHIIHQALGMSVCPKHGCQLETYVGEVGEELSNPVFEKLPYKPNGRKIAELYQSLVDSRRSIFAEDLRDALLTRIRKVYGNKPILLLAEDFLNDDLVPEALRESTRQFIQLFNERFSMTDIGFAMNLFARFFDDGKDMMDSIIDKSAVEKKFFMKQIEGRFELLSDYNKETMKLRCLNCKHEFYATAYDITHGNGCPACDNTFMKIPKAKRDVLYDKALTALFKDIPEEYQLIKVRTGRASILHKNCGRAFTVDAIKFLTELKCPFCSNHEGNTRPVGEFHNVPLHHPILGAEVGIPVCDTLFHMLGLRDKPMIKTIAVYDPGFLNEAMTTHRCEPFDVIYGMKGTYDKSLELEYAFLDTLCHALDYDDKNNCMLYELAYWMKHHGVTAESLARVEIPSYKPFIARASNLLMEV